MATHDTLVIADYLSVMIKGSLSVAEFRAITDEVLVLCRERDIHKVIVDVLGTRSTIPDADKIEFAKYASDVLKNDVVKYAYIYPKEFLNYSSQFIAQGRGLNVRAYYTVEDALQWIEN